MRSALAIGAAAVLAGSLPAVGDVGADPVPVTDESPARRPQGDPTRWLATVRSAREAIVAEVIGVGEALLEEARQEPEPAAEAPVVEPVAAPTVREQLAAQCPAITDSDLLRDGAAVDGLGLCERSVHAARTDVSAAAVVEGFGLLGIPYSRGRRGQDGYDDCSSFVGRSYRDAGRPLSGSDWEPSSSGMLNASWATVVDDALPGDILWRRGHVAIALADGYLMHASQSGDVTHVEEIGRYSRVLAVDAVEPAPSA